MIGLLRPGLAGALIASGAILALAYLPEVVSGCGGARDWPG